MRTRPRALPALILALGLASLGLSSCGVSDGDADAGHPNNNEPAGRIEGTIVYEGPPPPTDPASGRPTGRVVLLLFHHENPPPPQGLATSAESLVIVAATELFAGMVRVGPNRVRASVPFMFPNIETGGLYQVRAFYSRGEYTASTTPEGRRVPTGFHPLYTVRNQPSQGDVAGGAVESLTALGAPRYAAIPVGSPTPDGDGGLRYVIPPRGSVARGVTVSLQSDPLPERPVFHHVAGSSLRFRELAPEIPPNDRARWPEHARLTGFLAPSGRVLELEGNVVVANESVAPDGPPTFLLRGAFGSMEERTAALRAGFDLAEGADPSFLERPFDYNNDGALQWDLMRSDRALNLDAHPTILSARVPSHRLPWVFPLVVLSKLHDPTPEEAALLASPSTSPATLARILSAINRPESGYVDRSDPARPRPVYPVVVFGSVVPGGDPATGLAGHNPPWNTPRAVEREETVRVIFSPIALELQGPSPSDWVAIIPPVPPAFLTAVGPALAQTVPPRFRCATEPEPSGIPAGRYALNLVAPTGQAWTTPNELAPLALGAQPTDAPSQGLIVRIRQGMPVSGMVCPPRP